MGSKLLNFKGILNEFFYDWGYTPNPQIKQESDGGFWINKTSLFIREGEYHLTYKLDSYLVSPKAFANFQEFYTHLYQGDEEFAAFLDALSDVWMFSKASTFTKTPSGYCFGDLVLTIASDYSGALTLKGEESTLQKSTVEKIERFITMLKNK